MIFRSVGVVRRWCSRNPTLAFGLAGTGVLFVLVIVAPLVLPRNPVAMHRLDVLRPPSGAFPLGTDELGRDILARVIAGTRVSYLIGGAAAVLGGIVGVISGITAGYSGGFIDTATMRLWDILLAFPHALLGIAVAALIGPGTVGVVVATALVGVPFFSRVARASTLVEKEREYIMAARSVGAGHAWILRKHILPNAAAPILVQASATVAQAILLEAALSFIGLGIQPPQPSLGAMLNEARSVLGRAPWYPLFPGVALFAVVITVNSIADGLSSLLRPRRL